MGRVLRSVALVAAMLVTVGCTTFPPGPPGPPTTTTATPAPTTAAPAATTAAPVPTTAAPTTTTASPSEAPPAQPMQPWVTAFGGPTWDEAWGIDRAPDGGVFVATHQTVPGLILDTYVYRLRADGTVVWRTRSHQRLGEKSFPVRYYDGVVYVGGAVLGGFDPAKTDAIVLALDAETGAIRWTWIWDGDGNAYEEVDGLVPTSDGVYVSGWTTGATTGNDVLLAHLHLDGTLDWVRPWGGPGWDENDGHLVLVGDRLCLAGKYNGSSYYFGGQALVACYSKDDGSLAWSKTSANYTDYLSLATDGQRLYAVGFGPGGVLGPQIILAAYDLDGNLRWTTSWRGDGNAISRSVTVDPFHGELVVVGSTETAIGQPRQVAILRYGTDGKPRSEARWGGAGDDVAKDAAVDALGVFVVGTTTSFGAGDVDGFVLRIDARDALFPVVPSG